MEQVELCDIIELQDLEVFCWCRHLSCIMGTQKPKCLVHDC